MFEHGLGVSDREGVVDMDRGNGGALFAAMGIYSIISVDTNEAARRELSVHVLVPKVGTLFDIIETHQKLGDFIRAIAKAFGLAHIYFVVNRAV